MLFEDIINNDELVGEFLIRGFEFSDVEINKMFFDIDNIILKLEIKIIDN